MSDQSTEKPVTVGYLKQLFERLNLPDDAVLYYNNQEWGWCSVGPEGEEIMFITQQQEVDLSIGALEEMKAYNKIQRANKQNGLAHHSFYNPLMDKFKKESGQ